MTSINASVVWQMHSGKYVRVAGNWKKKIYIYICPLLYFYDFFFVAQHPIADLGRFTVEVLRSHTGSVGHLWTRDRPIAETAIQQHSIHKRRTSMPLAVNEPASPANERPQTYASDWAAARIDCVLWSQCTISAILYVHSFINFSLLYKQTHLEAYSF